MCSLSLNTMRPPDRASDSRHRAELTNEEAYTRRTGGQRLLNEFVETLALDLPRFMEQTPKEKANFLLRIIGFEDQLRKPDCIESTAFNCGNELGYVDLQTQECAWELSF